MAHMLIHFAFALLLAAFGVLIGIGISCDVRRWLHERQASKQPRERVAQSLRVIRGHRS